MTLKKRLKKGEQRMIDEVAASAWEQSLPLVHELERITLEHAKSMPIDLRYEFLPRDDQSNRQGIL